MGNQEEIWKDVVGYEGKYKVSNLGRIKSILKTKEIILKCSTNEKGYRCTHLTINGHGKKKKVHRLVCIAFLENPNDYKQVNHIDGDKFNNRVENLEWCTAKQNVQHAIKNNLTKLTGLKKTEYWRKKTVDSLRNNFYKGRLTLLNTQTGIYYCSVQQAADSIPLKYSNLYEKLTIKNRLNNTNFIIV